MLTLAVSALVGLIVGALFRVTGLVHSIPGAILPALVALVATSILLMRRISSRVEPLVEEATRHMKAGRREQALKSLRAGLWLTRWHPLLEGQLRTQIGVLEYASNNLDAAIAELSRASKKPWEGPAFLGAAYYKKRDDAKMVQAFEWAVKASPKEGLAWATYAWCLLERKKRDEALAVLKRGQKELPGDARLDSHVEAIEGGKKPKMTAYGDTWAVFGLDGTVPGMTHLPKQARGFAQRPGFRQRPQRKR